MTVRLRRPGALTLGPVMLRLQRNARAVAVDPGDLVVGDPCPLRASWRAVFWPVPLPGPDGRRNTWHEAAQQAALEATKRWVRVKANMAAGTYDVDAAAAEIAAPEWPDLPMAQLLKLAFGDRMITSIDHLVVKRLRGLA